MTYKRSVGIDVSKATLDVCVLFDNGKVVQDKFRNNVKGIDELINFLSLHISKEAQIVVESTGDYHLLVSSKLFNKFNVQIINPLITKQYISANVRKVKSDKADAIALAKIGLQTKLNNHEFTSKELHKRKIISQINALEKHKAGIKLSLKNTKKTFNDFELSSEAFAKIEEAIKTLEKTIGILNNELSALVDNQESIKELESQKGITKETATILIAMIEDREFKTKGALVAYAGLDVAVKQSGTWVGKSRITKRGNSCLRKYLIQAGWGFYMHNDKFREYALKYEGKGRKYMEVLVIIARKFLKMLYGSMKNQKPFSVNYLT